MKHTCEMWAVVSDKTGIIYYSLAISEMWSVFSFLDGEEALPEAWEEYVEMGFRCVKVRVEEI